jgi:UDP-N-acetylglucosamine--N-acetylmuramyl-(pentapeptide) pyrophosphoryl-undecaprenol N-acetylglucosamine transferase
MATGRALRRRGHEVTLWLAGKDVEAPALRDWEGPVVTVPAEGLPSGFSLRALRATLKLLRAALACRARMRSERPDALLAMGSYASVGPVLAALWLGVPVILHEANVLPGRAVSLFSRWAAALAASFEETRFYLKRDDVVITGMPLRPELEEAALRAAVERPRHDEFTVLVTGGSRGAHRLNDIAAAALAEIHRRGHRIRAYHLTGFADEDAVRKVYAEADVPHAVYAFTADMAPLYAAADLAVCRSGAATCAELSVFAVPALLVPYPFAANDHQTVNARALEKAGAAVVVPERDLGVPWLVDYIVDGIRTPARLARMSAASKSRTVSSSADALADLVARTAESAHGPSASS